MAVVEAGGGHQKHSGPHRKRHCRRDDGGIGIGLGQRKAGFENAVIGQTEGPPEMSRWNNDPLGRGGG